VLPHPRPRPRCCVRHLAQLAKLWQQLVCLAACLVHARARERVVLVLVLLARMLVRVRVWVRVCHGLRGRRKQSGLKV